ncbi:MAG: ABC transporter permease [Acidimicrobiia bacterium]|nr:ABC transporter permease [Acidimicrobiia bacterium]MYC57924.1 ABC transporter permease [Acidimicrobiia bacterium]MYG93372.1 ABC transporter permease [Acidimicrobiia bacterium]MYI29847.1 ABC transporter permease [Acidimicrobiia bacterium]
MTQMTDAVTAVAVITGAEPEAPMRRQGRNLVLWLSAGWLVLVIMISVLAPWLGFLDDPYEPLVGPPEQGPSWSHWFGTDQLGRDMFARSVWGGRLSLAIAAPAVGIGIVVGGVLGVLAGYFGRWVDLAVSSLVNVALALPALVFALFIVTILGQTYLNVIIAVTILTIPAIARIARAQALRFAAREFVTVAHMMGAKWPRLLFREVVPNVVPALASIAFLAMGIVIIAEGSLSFIGMSVGSPSITWGNILSAGKGRLEDAPHIALITGGVMFVTLMALNFVGDEMLRRLDVREARI